MRYINLTSGNYEITLLTKEEYEKYNGMHRIPIVNNWWWLRSPGTDQNHAAIVYRGGSVGDNGNYVDYDFCAVRPALKSKILNLSVGTMFAALGNTWIMIDDHFAISVDIVSHQKYDDLTSTWETSYLKIWLEKWARDREESATHDYTVIATISFDSITAENEEEAKEMVKAWLRDGIEPDDGSVGFDVWGDE